MLTFAENIIYAISSFLIACCIGCLFGAYHEWRKEKKKSGGKGK